MKEANVISINLDCGVALHIKREILDNIELMDELVAIDAGDPTAVSRILAILLTAEEKKALYEALREDGRVPTSKVITVLKEMFDKIGEEGKNS